MFLFGASKEHKAEEKTPKRRHPQQDTPKGLSIEKLKCFYCRSLMISSKCPILLNCNLAFYYNSTSLGGHSFCKDCLLQFPVFNQKEEIIQRKSL